MRAQLRTYHSIPCLQVHQDANSQYKGLQDAPRLKSILKGSCEDAEQPNSLEKIQAAPVPRTNPVNLIFVLSQYAPKVTDDHIAPPRDFFDLIIRPTLSSRSRARAFLWLCWWYLEGDFTREAALSNPFGPGLAPPDDPNGIPMIVPDFEHLNEDQANAENVDTEEEKVYGEKMRLQRKRILEDDETVGPPLKKPAGPSPARSEVDRTRSPSPTTGPPPQRRQTPAPGSQRALRRRRRRLRRPRTHPRRPAARRRRRGHHAHHPQVAPAGPAPRVVAARAAGRGPRRAQRRDAARAPRPPRDLAPARRQPQPPPARRPPAAPPPACGAARRAPPPEGARPPRVPRPRARLGPAGRLRYGR